VPAPPARSAESGTERPPLPKESAAGISRTFNVCRDAQRRAATFSLPPARELEHYLELVSGGGGRGGSAGAPIILEGYEPPNDPRIGNFRVTPDPGVIEVNVQPSADWEKLSERTAFLYEAARESRLAAEKFMLDGRHTGTGGGNHFVLAVASTPDSPFLRRPDLLRSLVKLLAQSSVALLSLFRVVRRSHLAGAARGRSGTQRFAV